MIHLVIPGRPVPKERHRSGKGRTYTPPRTRAFERKVRLAAMAHQAKRVEGEVRVDVLVVHPDMRHGDVDNYAKALLDACQGVLFGNDKKAAELHVYRAVDKEETRIEAIIRPLAVAGLDQWERVCAVAHETGAER